MGDQVVAIPCYSLDKLVPTSPSHKHDPNKPITNFQELKNSPQGNHQFWDLFKNTTNVETLDEIKLASHEVNAPTTYLSVEFNVDDSRTVGLSLEPRHGHRLEMVARVTNDHSR